MKVSILIGGLSGGGAERVCCNLASYLVDKGHEVTIITMSDDLPSYSLNRKVNRLPLLVSKERQNFVFDSIKRIRGLCRYLKNTDSDIILSMLPVTMLLLLFFSHITSAKIVIAERNSPWRMNRIVQCLINRLANRADAWFFQTDDVRKWYGKYTTNTLHYVIPNAINMDVIIPDFKGTKRKTIVNVGRLNEQKNQILLIEAFSIVLSSHSDFTLEIYGEGPEKERLEQRISDLNLAESVILKGFSTNVVDSIKDAYCFVLSSDYEGMPNALMEAMALGLPCVSTDCDGGGAKFLIKNGENGLIVPKGDTLLLAKAINSLIENEQLANNIGKNAMKIKDELSASAIYERWEKSLIEIVQNTGNYGKD